MVRICRTPALADLQPAFLRVTSSDAKKSNGHGPAPRNRALFAKSQLALLFANCLLLFTARLLDLVVPEKVVMLRPLFGYGSDRNSAEAAGDHHEPHVDVNDESANRE